MFGKLTQYCCPFLHSPIVRVSDPSSGVTDRRSVMMVRAPESATIHSGIGFELNEFLDQSPACSEDPLKEPKQKLRENINQILEIKTTQSQEYMPILDIKRDLQPTLNSIITQYFIENANCAAENFEVVQSCLIDDLQGIVKEKGRKAREIEVQLARVGTVQEKLPDEVTCPISQNKPSSAVRCNTIVYELESLKRLYIETGRDHLRQIVKWNEVKRIVEIPALSEMERV